MRNWGWEVMLTVMPGSGVMVYELERSAPASSGATCTVTMSGESSRDRPLLWLCSIGLTMLPFSVSATGSYICDRAAASAAATAGRTA